MEVRLARNVDIDRITQIYYECSSDMQSRFGLDHWSNPYPLDILQRRINNGLVYMVIQNSVEIGTFMLEKEYPQPYIDAIGTDDVPFRYLTRLAIIPETQSKGIGSWTLKKAEEISKSQGASVLRFDLLNNYEQLKQFYIKNGYKEIGKGKTRRFTISFMEKEL